MSYLSELRIKILMLVFVVFSFLSGFSTTANAVVDPVRGTLAPGSSVRGVIDKTGYTHTYIFTLSSDSEVLFKCSTVDGQNVGVTVSDKNKELVYQDRQTIDTKLPLAAGVYYIDVYANPGPYTLSNVSTPQALANDREPNDTVSNAVPLGINSKVTGHAGYRSLRNYTDTDDVYKIVLPSGGKLRFSISSDATLTTSLNLSGENNVLYGYVYSSPVDLKAGVYYLQVHSGGYGGYTLSNTFAPSGPVVTQTPVNRPINTTVDQNVIFEDNFSRLNSLDLGPQWQKFKVRGGTGNTSALPVKADTPWSIKDNALHFEYTGDNTYTEDFIQTTNKFPVNNTKVEFEIRARAATSRGYVGPTAFWATSGENRSGAYNTTNRIPLIGLYASYRWENAGKKGLGIMINGGQKDYPNGVFSGLNQDNFAKHVIIIRNGKITYQSHDIGAVTLDLANPLSSDTKRHFSFGARLYDYGIPQVIDIRNLKITFLP